MILYGIIILITMIITILVNGFCFTDNSWLTVSIATCYFVVVAIFLDGIFAGFARWFIPKKWVNKDLKVYQVSKKEIKIYDFFKIKKWKHLVPDLGQFTKFQKNKIENPNDNEYLERYMMEACYGMWGHLLGAPLAFTMILFDFRMFYTDSNLWLRIALPLAIVNFFLDITPTFVLRYNLNRLQVMYKFNQKHRKA